MKNGHETTMKSPDQYRHFAQMCRLIARNGSIEGPKDEILEMAETWERLADGTQDVLRRGPLIGTSQEGIDLYRFLEAL
jgi:hypothetical protein